MEAYSSADIRFDAKYTVSDGGCWIWDAATNHNGYGQFRDGSRIVRAHRWSYERAHGPIPKPLMLDHICRRRECVNLDHLQLVTNKQNQEHRSGPQSNGTSGHRGVMWDKQQRKWRASAQHHGRIISAGSFDTVELAAQAATRLRRELFTNSLADL